MVNLYPGEVVVTMGEQGPEAREIKASVKVVGVPTRILIITAQEAERAGKVMETMMSPPIRSPTVMAATEEIGSRVDVVRVILLDQQQVDLVAVVVQAVMATPAAGAAGIPEEALVKVGLVHTGVVAAVVVHI
jgi:hypothetical protein